MTPANHLRQIIYLIPFAEQDLADSSLSSPQKLRETITYLASLYQLKSEYLHQIAQECQKVREQESAKNQLRQSAEFRNKK